MNKKLLTAALCMGLSLSFTAQAQFSFSAPSAYAFNADVAKAKLADINSDTYPDIIIAGGSAKLAIVLLNNKNGTFGAPILFDTKGFCASVAVGKIDCNDTPDLITTNTDNGTVHLFPGNSSGIPMANAGIDYTVSGQPMDIVLSDFDGNGKDDIATANLLSSEANVLLNANDNMGNCPGGGFSPLASYSTNSGVFSAAVLRSVDINLDGNQDLIIVNQASSAKQGISLLFGNAQGRFSQLTQFITNDTWTYDATTNDVNGDNIPDIITSNFTNRTISVLFGLKNAPWLQNPVTYSTRQSPRGIAVADFDMDGRQDLVVVMDDSIGIMRGLGEGTFSKPKPIVAFPSGSSSWAWALTGDLNKDGRPDIVYTKAGRVSVLLNTPATLNSKEKSNPEFALLIYPNPSYGSITLSSPYIKDLSDIAIYDIMGRLIPFKLMGNQLFLSNPKGGLYYLKALFKGQKIVRKIEVL